jgi:hypothetical protein
VTAVLSRLTGTTTLADPPLDPSGQEGRDALGRELAKPDYYTDDLLDRVAQWLQRLFGDGVEGAADTPAVSTFLAILVVIALLTGVLLLAGRARRTARVGDDAPPALTDEAVSAAALRARAEAALAEGRFDDALVDAYRALAVRQIERGAIDDVPQATAHELARSLGVAFPTQQRALATAADEFDAVLYGDHPARHDRAAAMLALDDGLGAVRR